VGCWPSEAALDAVGQGAGRRRWDSVRFWRG
jgi:hypothetical protein